MPRRVDRKLKTILCVDDKEAGLSTRKMLLEAAGYKVLIANHPNVSPGDLPVKALSQRGLIGGGAACQCIRINGTTLCHGPVKAELVPKVSQ